MMPIANETSYHNVNDSPKLGFNSSGKELYHLAESGSANVTEVWNKSLAYWSQSPCSSLDYNSTNASFYCNTTDSNSTNATGVTSELAVWQVGLFGTLAGLTCLMTIIGNLVVILSFIIERSIRQPTNYFILSLACSDLLIGCISMPFYTVYLLANQLWPLGRILCDLWLSIDYTVCLTSIYTVFCITIDRFCMVKIPAKYRNWRSEKKVIVIITMTWFIPGLIFFTTIFGWQYFVPDGRTVPEEKCYVQYMSDALFNCVLQIGYFWITLVVMCVLYTGIYKVALNLQRKSDAKQKKMTSLVSMAGQTMTKIGIGMSQQQNFDTRKLFPQDIAVTQSTTPTVQGTSTTSFSSTKNNEKEDDRSSSPAFPSDTDPSSQSPKPHSPKKKHERKRKSSSAEKAKEKTRRNSKPNSKINAHTNSVVSAAKPEGKNNIEKDNGTQDHATKPPTLDVTFKPVASCKTPTPVYENSAMVNDEAVETTNGKTGRGNGIGTAGTNSTALAITSPPELLAGVRYIDQDSLKSLQSSDNIKLLSDSRRVNSPDEIAEVPESPIWKKRGTLLQNDLETGNKAMQEPESNQTGRNTNPKSTASHVNCPNPCAPRAVDCCQSLSPANIQVDTTKDDHKPVSRLAKPDAKRQVSSECCDNAATPSKRNKSKAKSRTKLAPEKHLRNLIRVGSGKRNKRNSRNSKDKSKSKSENRARKALRTISIILGAFLFCWTPWHILSMIIGFYTNAGQIVLTLYDISYWLCYLNSPINPFCYAFVNVQFKKTFIRILKLDWHRT